MKGAVKKMKKQATDKICLNHMSNKRLLLFRIYKKHLKLRKTKRKEPNFKMGKDLNRHITEEDI